MEQLYRVFRYNVFIYIRKVRTIQRAGVLTRPSDSSNWLPTRRLLVSSSLIPTTIRARIFMCVILRYSLISLSHY